MGLWTPEAEDKLLSLLSVANKDRPKTWEDLVSKFPNETSYNGICQECKTQRYTDARIRRKAQRLINEVDKLIKEGDTLLKKGSLAIPPNKPKARKGEEAKKVDAPVVKLTRAQRLAAAIGAVPKTKTPRAKKSQASTSV